MAIIGVFSATGGNASVSLAIRPQVSIDGLECAQIQWRTGAEPSVCTLYAPDYRMHEDVDITPGVTTITVRLNGVLVFSGKIWKIQRGASKSGEESLQYTALDQRRDMAREFVNGQVMVQQDGKKRLIEAAPLVFNPVDRDANVSLGNYSAPCGAAAKAIAVEADWSYAFHPSPTPPAGASGTQTRGLPWSATDMLSLIFDYLDYARDGTNKVGNVVHGVLTAGISLILTSIRDLRLEGLQVHEAVQAVIDRAGARWWLRPRSATQGTLRIFKRGDGPKKRVYLPNMTIGVIPDVSAPTLTPIASAVVNIDTLDWTEDYATVVGQVFAVSAPDRHQPTAGFTMKRGWTAADEADVIAASQAAGQSVHEYLQQNPTLYKTVGRLWVLNEDGNQTVHENDRPDPAAPAPPEDLSIATIFGTANYARRPRRFLNEQTVIDATTKQPKQSVLRYTSIAGNAIEIPLPRPNPDAPNTASIYLESVPAENAPDALWDGSTRYAPATQLPTVHAAIEGDAAVTEYKRLPDDLVTDFASRAMLQLQQEYARRFLNGSVVDGSIIQSMQDRVDELLAEREYPSLTVNVVIPFITLAYEPGDMLDEVVGRGLMFDNQAQIVGVNWDFENQSTELVTERVDRAFYRRELRPPRSHHKAAGPGAQALRMDRRRLFR